MDELGPLNLHPHTGKQQAPVAVDNAEHASMIRRYITWRNRHTTDPRLRKVVRRAEVIKRAKVA